MANDNYGAHYHKGVITPRYHKRHSAWGFKIGQWEKAGHHSFSSNTIYQTFLPCLVRSLVLLLKREFDKWSGKEHKDISWVGYGECPASQPVSLSRHWWGLELQPCDYGSSALQTGGSMSFITIIGYILLTWLFLTIFIKVTSSMKWIDLSLDRGVSRFVQDEFVFRVLDY